MSKEIPLTQGKVAIVDDDDFELIKKYKWCAVKSCNTYYAMRIDCTNKKRRFISMHRLIMDANSGVYVDHVNGSGLDNRKENLRVCNNSENCRNQRVRINNSSGYKGVDWHKNLYKWRTRIMIDGKYTHLGLFSCIIKAAKCYNEAAIKHYGKFAKLNKI